jgi:hypothetical protein
MIKLKILIAEDDTVRAHRDRNRNYPALSESRRKAVRLCYI